MAVKEERSFPKVCQYVRTGVIQKHTIEERIALQEILSLIEQDIAVPQQQNLGLLGLDPGDKIQVQRPGGTACQEDHSLIVLSQDALPGNPL